MAGFAALYPPYGCPGVWDAVGFGATYSPNGCPGVWDAMGFGATYPPYGGSHGHRAGRANGETRHADGRTHTRPPRIMTRFS